VTGYVQEVVLLEEEATNLVAVSFEHVLRHQTTPLALSPSSLVYEWCLYMIKRFGIIGLTRFCSFQTFQRVGGNVIATSRCSSFPMEHGAVATITIHAKFRTRPVRITFYFFSPRLCSVKKCAELRHLFQYRFSS